MNALDVQQQLAEFARDLRAKDTTLETIDVVVAAVVEQVGGADLGGVSLIRGKGAKVETLAVTDPVVEEADLLQVELADGPWLDALTRQEVVHAPDLASEDRWPTWAPACVERLGVRSMIAVQLFIHERDVGALTLYSREAHAFTTADLAEVTLWAAHAAVALAASQKIDQLESAVLSRGEIGQAQGIIMERFDLGADAAFAVLRRLSQTQNVRLVEVARTLVRTRVLPTAD